MNNIVGGPYPDKGIQMLLYPITIPYRLSYWLVGWAMIFLWGKKLLANGYEIRPSNAWRLIDEDHPNWVR